MPPIGYERLLNEKSTQRKGTPVLPSPQLNPSRVRKVGTPGPFENSINHAQQITGTITPKTSGTDCSLLFCSSSVCQKRVNLFPSRR